MKDKVAAKRKRQKAKSEPAEGGGSGGTNGVPPKTPETSGDGSGPEDPNQTPKNPKRDLWGFFAEILSPIIIAIMTIVITFATWWQWTATDGQLTEMKKATEQVDRSLELLKAQTDLGKDTLISSQRAWIAPMTVSINTPFSYGNPLNITVQYQNTGREPAINVKWDMRLRQAVGSPSAPPIELGNKNVEFCSLARNKLQNIYVYPSDTPTYQLIQDATIDKPIGAIFEGTRIIYLEGCVVYETFGESHESRFCFYWVNIEAKNIQEWTWRFCPNGNEGN